MKTYVEFRSDLFPPYEDEFEKTNPGRWGKRLSEFLIESLRKSGIEVINVFAEDWGWVIQLKYETINFKIGCGNFDEYLNGYLCFIETEVSIIRKIFSRENTSNVLYSFINIFDNILNSESSITDILWRSTDNFEK